MLQIKLFVLSFEEKKHDLVLPTFKLPASTKHFLRIVFSCLYLPQYKGISIVWLWRSDEYVNFWFWAKVHLYFNRCHNNILDSRFNVFYIDHDFENPKSYNWHHSITILVIIRVISLLLVVPCTCHFFTTCCSLYVSFLYYLLFP